MKKIKYANDDITVVWQPELCQHYALCFNQLPQVFDPRKRAWIDPYGASSECIIEQVNRCPSGALSYVRDKKDEDQSIK